jgi:hypothetical protein
MVSFIDNVVLTFVFVTKVADHKMTWGMRALVIYHDLLLFFDEGNTTNTVELTGFFALLSSKAINV